jgi:hypothetical protein
MPTDRVRQRVGCGIWNEDRAQRQKLRRRPAGRSDGQQSRFADEFLTGAGSKHAQIMRSGTFCLVRSGPKFHDKILYPLNPVDLNVIDEHLCNVALLIPQHLGHSSSCGQTYF